MRRVAAAIVGVVLVGWLAMPIVRLVPDLARLVRALLADDTTPRSVKVVLGGLLVYLLSPIDLVPEGLVLILHALFGPLPIVDVGSGRVPVKQPSMFIAKRVVLDEQPTVLAVLPAHAPLNGERNPARERVLPLAPQPLDVLRMEDQPAKRRCPHGLDGETGKVERRLIRGDGVPVRV